MGANEDLLSRIAGLDADVRRMLREDLPVQLAAIRRALDDGDFVSAKQEVHAVHGSAAFCKLESLRGSAAVFEQSLHNDQKNAGHTRAFENNVNAVIHVLENYKETG